MNNTRKLSKLIIFFLILINISITLFIIIFYDSFLTKNTLVIYKEQIIQDNNISDREAEEINLNNFQIDTISSPNNSQYFNIKYIDGKLYKHIKLPSKSYIIFNNQGDIIESSQQESDTILAIEIIDFIPEQNSNNEFIDRIIENVQNIFKNQQNLNLNTIFFTSSFADNYFNEVIQRLKQNTNKKIILALNLKWGDKVNYNEYFKYKQSKVKKIDLNTFNNIVDEYWIENFDYTTPMHALAGPISKNKLTVLTLRYYLLNNLPYLKSKLWINTMGYLWGYREYEENHILNFIYKDQQAEIKNGEEVNIILQNEHTIIKECIDQDKVIEIKLSNVQKSKILVFPTKEFIDKQIEISRKHGLTGVIIF